MTSTAAGEPRTIDAPLPGPAQTQTFQLPPGLVFDLEAVFVEIDATGAAGAVTAELTISEQTGVTIATKSQAATIPAGTTGSATWALRLTDEPSSSSGGGGVQFNTDPQAGGYLFVEVDGPSGPHGFGFEVLDANGNGSVIQGIPVLLGDVANASNGADLLLHGQGIDAEITGAQSFRIRNGYGGTPIMQAQNAAGTPKLGFFGVAPVIRQATPVTLADVIALLQAYGLAT